MHRTTRLTLRQLRRLTLLYLLLPAAVLLTLRLAWGLEASHRLDKTRAQLLAQGIRLNPTSPAIPDDQNATIPYQRALNALDVKKSEEKLVDYGDDPETAPPHWTGSNRDDLLRILARNAAALEAMNDAAALPSAHWAIRDTSEIESSTHRIAKSLTLSHLLFGQAILAHEDYHETEALDKLGLIVALSKILDTDLTELSHLFSLQPRARACFAVEAIVPELQLRTSDGSLDAARNLLKQLAVSPHDRDARALAWEAETNITEIQEARAYPSQSQWWICPMLLDDLRRTMLLNAAEIPSLRADNWQSVKSLSPRNVYPSDSFLDRIVMFGTWGSPSYSISTVSNAYSKYHFHLLADSAAVSLLLAARIYQSSNGHYPTNPQDIVPDILPTLPIDPYAADHRPMAYRLDPTGPTVWSVGENGTDEGATVLSDSSGEKAHFRYNKAPDMVYGAAWRAATPAPKGASPSSEMTPPPPPP